MSFDLLFGTTKRDWSRSRDLITSPSLPPVAPTPTRLDNALSQAIAANPGIVAKPSGKGAIVSKKFKWG